MRQHLKHLMIYEQLVDWFVCIGFSPGVTITDLQKRGGLDEEKYAAVSDLSIRSVSQSINQ